MRKLIKVGIKSPSELKHYIVIKTLNLYLINAGVMTLLDTSGLCVFVFACLLYYIEKTIFEYNYYGIIYDTGGMLCSYISSILPSSC